MALEQAGVQLIASGASAFDADMKSATKAVDSFGVETKKAADLIQDAAGRWRTASGKFATDAEKAAAGVAKVTPAAKKAGDAAKKAGDDAEKGGRGFHAFGEIVTGALREVGRMATNALADAARATAAFVGDSINLAGDFEAGMLEFQSVAGRDVDTTGLVEFRDLFLDIGKRLPVSTSEVQQAAIEMVKGGIDPATIAAGGLEQNIQFAAAAMKGDLVKAAEISSKIMGGWAGVNATAAEKAEFLTHATDLLAKAANASSTDVEGLALGIFNSQGIARTAGVSFDDLTTTLAALAPRFESSSVAGNSLKNMIARLQPTTDPAAAAMMSLGLYTAETGSAFYDAAGNFVGFEQAAQLLQDSLQGLTKEQQAATLQQIFGNDAMGAAAGLAELGAGGYQHMADALANANGVAEAAALKQQGFNTALDNAKGSVEALQITLGSALLPILTDLMNNVVAPAVNTLTDMASALGGNQEAFDKLSPAMQDVTTTVQQLIADVQDLVSWFGTADDSSSDLGGAVEDLNGIWEKAQDVVDNVMAGYQDIAESVLPIVTQFVEEHGDEISAFFKTTYDSIIEIVNLALDTYNAIVPPILHAIAGFIDEHGSEIERILKAAWDIISSLITGTLDTIKGIFKTTLALINGDWEGAWNGIKGIADTQVKAIEGIITGFLNIIAGIFDTDMDAIGQTWEDNWNMLVDIVTETDWAQVGQDVVDGIKQGLIDNWNRLTSWVSDKIGSLVDSALAAIGAGSPAVAWMPVGEFSVQGIMQGFTEMWPALEDLVSGLSDDLVKQAADMAANVQSAIADAFGATASIDRQKVGNLRAVAGLGKDQQATVQSQINAAEKIALAMNDPQQAADYFRMRSKGILELAELQDKINEAQIGSVERQTLLAQQDLINAAQGAEMQAFNARRASQGNPMEAIAAEIGKLLTQIPINDTGVGANLRALLAQIGGTIAPVATAAQLMASGNSTTNNQQTSYNMPIYTNQSPAVLQQSMAILQASMA